MSAEKNNATVAFCPLEHKRRADVYRRWAAAYRSITQPFNKDPVPMSIDFSKPVQTRSGLPVRLLCLDRAGAFPVLGLIKRPGGTEMIGTYTERGRYAHAGSASGLDLENVPETPQPKRHHLAMIGYALGLPIQYRPQSRTEWTDCKTPSFQEHVDYRIKPGYEHHFDVMPVL